MKGLLTILFILFLAFSNAQEKTVEVITFERFEPMLHNENDTLYIINFWATWCKPCVAELPYFEKLNKVYASEKLKVILVSLDFADEMDTRLVPFLLKNNIQSKVILLDESNPNTFIDKVSPQWSGAIPATVIYKGKYNSFYEKSFVYEELESIVKLKLSE